MRNEGMPRDEIKNEELKNMITSARRIKNEELKIMITSATIPQQTIGLTSLTS